MRILLIITGLAAIVTLGVLVHGCSLTSDQLSCTKKGASGAPELCIEYSDFSTASSVNAKASLSLLCKGFGASLDDKLCDVSTALVGCTKSYQGQWTQTTWYYPVAMMMTSGDFSCGDNEQRLGPDRNPLNDVDQSVPPDQSAAIDQSVAHDLATHD